MSDAPIQVDAGGLRWHLFLPEDVPSFDADNTRADNTRTGAASPLVILHGLFGSGDNWRGQANALATNRAVLVPDMPNHGASCHTDQTSYDAVAALLWDALDALGDVVASTWDAAGTFSLLGHSMGGKAAMAMAFARPGSVDALVVADIAPRAYPPHHDEVFQAMEAVAAADVQRRGEADRIMERWLPTKAVRLFLLKSLVPADDGDEKGAGYRWRLNLPALRDGYDGIGGWPFSDETYDGPTLFIAGGASSYIQATDGDAILRHFPESRIETIPNVGHWLHAEARETFVSMVYGFLS